MKKAIYKVYNKNQDNSKGVCLGEFLAKEVYLMDFTEQHYIIIKK
jgi:hypothetical protein